MNRHISNAKNARHAMALLAMAVLVSLALLPTDGAEPASSPRKVKLRILFAGSLIYNFNRDDALIAFKLWVETVGRNKGFLLEAKADFYDRLDEVEQRIREKTVDLVVCTSMDYLQIAQGGPMEPVFAAIRKPEAMFDSYVIVTRRDRNLAALPALRGKSVAFFQTGANLGRQWMDVILGESGLGPVNDFFGSNSDSAKASSVVLPVFFGKLDVGVVNRSSLETMQEMNPQLTAQLQVLTNSPCMPESVICLHRDFTEARGDLLGGLAELHSEPHGQQLLLVFKLDKLVPFKSEYLDGVRDIKTRRAKLETPPGRLDAIATAGRQPKP